MNIHKFIISLLVSLLVWTLINNLIIPGIPLWKYLIIELLIAFGTKLTQYIVKRVQFK